MILARPCLLLLGLPLSELGAIGNTVSNAQSPYHDRHEMRALTRLAERVESMLTLAPQTQSRAWVPPEKCHEGKTHLFISGNVSLEESCQRLGKLGRAWTVLAVIAAAKYAPSCPVEIHVLALEGPRSLNPNSRLFTVEMSIVRKIHRHLQNNEIGMDAAWQMLSANWKKVPHDTLPPSS